MKTAVAVILFSMCFITLFDTGFSRTRCFSCSSAISSACIPEQYYDRPNVICEHDTQCCWNSSYRGCGTSCGPNAPTCSVGFICNKNALPAPSPAN